MGHCRICACKCILYKCIKFTQDAIHHVVQIDKSVQKEVLHGMFVYHQFLFIKQTYLNRLQGYFHKSFNLVHIVSFGIYCSVLERGGGRGWGSLISNLNSVCLRFTGATWKKEYSCYISFFTNFSLIYWTCLIRFGGKFHRSCNLAHTVRDLE